MATVNFSVPEEVKQAFNRTFAGRNKSAIVAELMIRAVEEEAVLQRRREAMERLLSRRRLRPAVSKAQIRAARESLRK